ncbi:MAG: hypothetical protein Q9204_002082 [Flavoplaca sp. TL-2023a]
MANQYQELLESVSDISRESINLSEEFSGLHQHQALLDSDPNCNSALLKQLLKHFVSLSDYCALENTPVSSDQTFLNGPISSLTKSCRGNLEDLLVSSLDVLSEIEEIARARAEMADDCQLHAAHLAHRAAVQEDSCKVRLDELSFGQRRTQQQMTDSTAKAQIIRSDMAFNQNHQVLANNQAQDRSVRAENHEKWFLRTWWIPGVNLITVPVTIARSVRHDLKREEYEAVLDHLEQEMRKFESSKDEIESQTELLFAAQKQLEGARILCTDIRNSSQQQKIEAQISIDHLQAISTQSKDTKKILLRLRQDTSGTRSLRLAVLQKIVELSKNLLNYELYSGNEGSSEFGLFIEAYDEARAGLEEPDILASLSKDNLPLLDDF